MFPSEKEKIKLSKLLSLILRHKPQLLNLKLDNEGFVNVTVEELTKRIRKKFKGFSWIQPIHIYKLEELNNKGRFQIRNGRIRALYGHSISHVTPSFTPNVEIPSFLYHGTSLSNVKKILREGLKPMKRNFVHLTDNFKDAAETGKKRSGKVAVLIVDAEKALKNNVEIWKAGKTVYCAKEIPPAYIVKVEIVS